MTEFPWPQNCLPLVSLGHHSAAQRRVRLISADSNALSIDLVAEEGQFRFAKLMLIFTNYYLVVGQILE